MRRWEYKYVWATDVDYDNEQHKKEDLNVLGRQGWEVVCLIDWHFPKFLLKREIIIEEPLNGTDK